jgi:diaminopimelate epimerase
MKPVKFFKYQGAGNDFILLEDFNQTLTFDIKEYISFMCVRNFGIGADGLILLQPSKIADAKMRIFNSDGGEATMCGNGLRCAVKHFDKAHVSIETLEGIAVGENEDTAVSVTLPKIEEVLSPLALSHSRIGHLYHTGVPHLVISVDSLEVKDFEQEAKELRYHKMFAPDGVNVSYIKEIDNDLHIRTYERGVEKETLACGTACAAATLLLRKNDKKKKSQYRVFPKSGNALQFTFDSQERIWMKGPAEAVFCGEIDLSKVKNNERNY